MLDELVVENLGLIASARIEPGPGLVTVTGETGAGKTLLLGALRLLRGDTARTDRIGPADTEARVEGRFVLADGTEIVVARRLAAGRSRAYVDGSMVPARVLEERLGGLVEIVGQHEHLSLGRETALRSLVDARLDLEGITLRDAYREAWTQLGGLRRDREGVGGDRRSLERELDLSRHQADEIRRARIRPDEEAGLASGIDRLRHAGEIAAALAAAARDLAEDGAAVDLLGSAVAATRRAAGFDPTLRELADSVEGLAAEAGDLAIALRRAADDVEQDPDELERLNRRLAVLADLRRKYGSTLIEVISFGEEASARADEIDRLLSRAEGLDAELAAAEERVALLGEQLMETRRRAAKTLAETATGHLRELGFGDPIVDLRIDGASRPGPAGADRIELRFASDSALPAGPVSRIASGGELSRLVLAIRLAGGIADAPVVAFDEIDAGVGGTTALALGEKLARLATARQVLVVTHLPQVAAYADTHLVLDREHGRASVRRVTGKDRVAELTRMLGGLPESLRGREHAEELIARAAATHPG